MHQHELYWSIALIEGRVAVSVGSELYAPQWPDLTPKLQKQRFMFVHACET